jgi:hypothetical protein
MLSGARVIRIVMRNTFLAVGYASWKSVSTNTLRDESDRSISKIIHISPQSVYDLHDTKAVLQLPRELDTLFTNTRRATTKA